MPRKSSQFVRLAAAALSLACSSGGDGPGSNAAAGTGSRGGAGMANSSSGSPPSDGRAAGAAGAAPNAAAGGPNRNPGSGGTDMSTNAAGGAPVVGGNGPAAAGALSTGGGAGAAAGQANQAGGVSQGGTGAVLAEDDFKAGLENWYPELEGGGAVTAVNGALDIDVPAGATVWYKRAFTGPLVIEFEATAVSAGGANDHVTDLNMFWNARDVRSPQDLFARKRSGAFADYDYLTTYYVGYGANLNTTTRMRRYVGEAGNRPLLFDLTSPLLVANRTYRVKLVADGSKVQYSSDGAPLFDYKDAAPYTSGWFAFRTVASHLRFAAFKAHRP